LQIEINRGLYMDERNYRRKPAFARLAADLAALVELLGEVIREWLAHTADRPDKAASLPALVRQGD
jgi:N-formylglutamate amidohydrolase